MVIHSFFMSDVYVNAAVLAMLFSLSKQGSMLLYMLLAIACLFVGICSGS